ncbi:hypothetical protein J1P26_22415 [Neobacillus sp. MM2021_6]|uniref:hypothetical protein n=1 Tax=Bacillaceae TaxID=186817 RepID=UPI001408C62E|nr:MULTISPECIES: hypothetical protein [Bacillaceae]MBO0962451.1 hypothetical protein [Neobacillus sp. MM2021_6]NHC21226.1 hypothetical protein [Bacillus sp. MM2020_4]
MKTKSMTIREFISGDFRREDIDRKKKRKQRAKQLAIAAILPLATGGTIGTLGFTMKAFAATNVVPVAAPIAVEVTAKEWMGEQTLSTLAHVLDPVVDILVALSFPIASVVIVGACFLFMFGNAERAWTMIQNAGLGYILIQVSPLIMEVLKQVGSAV